MRSGVWQYPSPHQPTPTPKQQRAIETIRAAVAATVELLERLPPSEITLKAIRERSGVSQGSLTHHFGSREALIATAHVARYERSCAADAAFLSRYRGALSTAEEFIPTILDHISEMLSEHRREVRWVRLSAIGAAFRDAELTSTLSSAYTALADELTGYADEARCVGLIEDDADPRSIALLLSMHAQGLVLDDLLGDDVPKVAWHHLMTCFVASFLTASARDELYRRATERHGEMWRAEVFGRAGRVPHEVAERLRALRDAAGNEAGDEAGHTPVAEDADGARDTHAVRRLLELAERTRSTEHSVAPPAPAIRDIREPLLTLAAATLRESGEAGIDVAELRTAADLSPQAFHRTFGGRDSLVREVRIRLEVSRAAHSIVRFADLVAGSSSPADMRAGLEAGAMRLAQDAERAAMWQRIETLAAARTDAGLRSSLARVQRVARDLLIEQVCLAQSRQLMDPMLPARGVARLLDGSVFWHVFHGLDARRPAREEWAGMLRRIATLLSPDAPSSHRAGSPTEGRTSS